MLWQAECQPNAVIRLRHAQSLPRPRTSFPFSDDGVMSDTTRTTTVDANAAFTEWALPTVGSSQARTAYTSRTGWVSSRSTG